jgi:predicted MFS family arabinose efflux permease
MPIGVTEMTGYRIAFLMMAGLAVVAALLVIPIAETRHASPPRPGAAARASRGRWNPLRTVSPAAWPVLLRLWATNSVNGLAVGFFGPFITYWFYVRYGAGPGTIGVVYTLINVAALASNLYAPRLAARLGLVRAIFVGRILQSILMIPMALAPNLWLAAAFYLIRMQAQRIALPLRQSYVMAVVPAEERGSVGALSNLPMQATSAMSPGIAGYIFANVSLALPFEIGAALQALNAVLFYTFFHNLRPPEERATPDAAPEASALAAAPGAPDAARLV